MDMKKRFLAFGIALPALFCAGALAFLACSCHRDPAEPEIPVDQENIRIAEAGVSPYSIAYAGDLNNAKGLAAALKDLTGAELPVYKEADKSSGREILLGATTRPETVEALSSMNGKEGFVIRVVGEKLVIAGTNDVWTALALYHFQDKVLKAGSSLSDGNLILPKSLSRGEANADPLLIGRLLQRGYKFSLRATKVLSCPGDDGMTVAQGAASDGRFFYFVNRKSDESVSAVYKYNMTTKTAVARSTGFYAGHCNDMTYDSVKKRLVIAHGQSEGKILTPVDAATLTPQPNVTISVGSGAITYNATHGKYAISQGGKTFYVTDGDFKVELSKTRTDVSNGYTAQGMGSDDYYVYFPMSGSKDNALVVYDWEGKYVTTLTIPLTLESESMFYAAGVYYVNFYSKGAQLYRIDPVFSYTYSK